jgi:PAS domain-containing protein
MRRALSGLSGTVVGLDYRGEIVLAVYEPVAELNWGIVAKIDLAEVRGPFVKAGIIAICAALLVVLVGAVIFLSVSNPMIRRLKESENLLREQFAELDHIYANAPVGLCLMDTDLRFVRINEKLEWNVRISTHRSNPWGGHSGHHPSNRADISPSNGIW